jgi:hypothetical protein
MTKAAHDGRLFRVGTWLSPRMFLGEDEHLPDDRTEQGMLVVMARDGGTLIDDDLVAAGATAVDAGILDDLAGFPFLVEGPGLHLNEVGSVFILCHATRTCLPTPVFMGVISMSAILAGTYDQTVIHAQPDRPSVLSYLSPRGCMRCRVFNPW